MRCDLKNIRFGFENITVIFEKRTQKPRVLRRKTKDC